MFDKKWFKIHQKLLLKFANTFIGKRFFRIQKSSLNKATIIEIAPNYIKWVDSVKDGKVYYSSEFRTHSKFSKRILYGLYPVWWLCHQWDTLIANRFVPAWNLGFDTLTSYPAAGANSPVDGEVSRNIGTSEETFANIRAGAGNSFDATVAQSNTTHLSAYLTQDLFNLMQRSIYCFDTSSIGAGSISSAVFSLYVIDKWNGLGGDGFTVVASTPASTANLQNSDYGQLGSTSFANITYDGATASQYNDLNLNASGISNIDKGGISKFGTRGNWDFNGSFTGTWAADEDFIQTSWADDTGTTQDPKLVVTYTGSSSLKTINNLAKANVKTVDGLAIASVKSWDGLT